MSKYADWPLFNIPHAGPRALDALELVPLRLAACLRSREVLAAKNGTLRQGLEDGYACVREEQEDEQQRGETTKRAGLRQRDKKSSTQEEGGEEEGPVQR